jgi:hypothetical protein
VAEAGEGEGAAGVLIGANVELEACGVAAEGERVGAFHEAPAGVEAELEIAAEGGGAVAEGAEVGEGEVGGAPVFGVLGGALDAELLGDVAGVGEEGGEAGGVALEP